MSDAFAIVGTCLLELRRTVSASVWATTRLIGMTLPFAVLLLAFLSPSATSFSCVAVVAVLTFFPLEWSSFGFIDRLFTIILQDAAEYFPLCLKLADPGSLDPRESYLVGFEPHSYYPVSYPVVFSDHSPLRPPQLKGIHMVVSGLTFRIPLLRQLFWWTGFRSASRSSITQILKSGKSVALVPGGVREMQHMEPQKEVLFLKKRLGFVRLAIQQGRPLLPVFAFNQTPTYTATTFGLPQRLVEFIGRRIGMRPMMLMGRFGTTIPKKSPILVVIGTPIPIPRNAEPDASTTQTLLDQFIAQMEQIFEQYKDEAGVKNTQLKIV